MNIYHSGEYITRNPTWHEEDSPGKARDAIRLLKRNDVVPRTIVEVGTGAGEVLRLLSLEFPAAACDGYEISEGAFAIARQKQDGNLRYHHGSPLESANRFDLLLAMDIFEHVDDYLGFLRQCRALADWKIYNIPLDLSVRSLMQKGIVLGQRKKVGHLHYFFKDTALATLTYTGHEIVDWFYTTKALKLGGRPLRWPAVALRKLLFAANADLAARVLGGFSMTVLCR